MAQFRNITDTAVLVITDRGLEKVEADAILTVSDEYAAQVYFQTGETGETPLWAAVSAPAAKKADAAPAVDPTPAPETSTPDPAAAPTN
jgi:hypothetical protein